MAGKQIGEFSFKITSLTFGPEGPDGVALQMNCEGRAPNGTVAVTLACTPGKSGSFTTYAANYLDDGDITTSKGIGSFESTGTHRWRTQADIVVPNGRKLHTEGEVDLAGRSWSGKVFEN
jgi:hypothetical protein